MHNVKIQEIRKLTFGVKFLILRKRNQEPGNEKICFN